MYVYNIYVHIYIYIYIHIYIYIYQILKKAFLFLTNILVVLHKLLHCVCKNFTYSAEIKN